MNETERNNLAVVHGMHGAGFSAERKKAVKVANAIVGIFLTEQVHAPVALAVFHVLLRQLAHLANMQLQAAHDAGRAHEFDVPEIHVGHVLGALAKMAGYEDAEVFGLATEGPRNAPAIEFSATNKEVN